ncbi:MAG TPA: heterodisulfide reductase-related iron-sulfur binding cluster [Candidatus Baltobacteraceae bacterium]|jgi:glycolate oxidase iron-sulfur subunit|nr:heterodisulfide reductase-related iron-sulfur binding cluster [Candidatus Baltobacteraceae bacterium]
MENSAPEKTARSTVDLVADCVHCGFCLPACPTYRSWGNEADSPRGRIDLIKGVEEGSLLLDAATARHFDACLGCMACVSACPSGVRYDTLIERTRARVESEVGRSIGDRLFRSLIFSIFPYPKRLRAVSLLLFLTEVVGLRNLLGRLQAGRLLPPRLRELATLAPTLRREDLGAEVPAFIAAQGEYRGRVALIAGCVQRVFFPRVNAATARVLSAEGYDVVTASGQGCCGALSLHGGYPEQARAFARALLDRVRPENDGSARYDAIVINAAGCGSTLKDYGTILADDPAYAERARDFAGRVRDVSEFLAGIQARTPRRALPIRAAYHDACHLAHAQGIREEPRQILRSIPGLELVEIPAGDECCGSAGVYNLLQPESAREIGERKVNAVLSVEPQLLVSANPGCTLHLRSLLAERGVDLPAAHPIEVLDATISGTELFSR